MTAEQTFKFSRAYKFYYQGKYDFTKYKGGMRTTPLTNQPDRRFYYRISQKLTDAQIHALYTLAYFYKPNAYLTDLVTPDAFADAIAFASRAENGKTLLEHDLYELAKSLKTLDLDAWLYGEWNGHQRFAIPECLQMVMNKYLPLDLAAILFLVPRVELDYHWPAFHAASPTAGMTLGASDWIERLKKADQLVRMQRPGWRALAWDLSKTFWGSLGLPLGPKSVVQHPALYE